jgi:hypothetical protein
MSTQPLTFTSPPNPPLPGGDLYATVLQCKDPDVGVGQKVRVTGYIATVNSITRRNTMGLANVQQDTAHAFDLGDLQFDDQGAAFVLQSVKDRIMEVIHKSHLPEVHPSAQMTLIDHVERLARYYGEAVSDCGRTRVDRLPEDTLLLPRVWATILGHEVIDWDGWNDLGRNLNIPCTREDFNRRIGECTSKLVNHVPRREPTADRVEIQLHHPEPTSAVETKMPCCGYLTKQGQPTPIYWNPYNKVVQCHNCGQQFAPLTFIEKIKPIEPKPGDNDAARQLKALGCPCVDAGSLVPGCPVHRPEQEQQEPPSRSEQIAIREAKLRERLPDTRYALTHKFDVGGQKGYVTVGFYDYTRDGDDEMDLSRPGEVFVVVQRQGSTLQGFADAWARSVSMLLQYGVPLSEVCRMFAWHKFEPRGITPNPDIRTANSIVDYVARWLGHTCIEGYQPGGEPVAEVPDRA